MAGVGESRVSQLDLNKKLEKTGERERLKQDFAKKLIRTRTSNGVNWREQLTEYCIEYLKNKGVERVTVDEIVAKIAPQGRATVPESLRVELLENIHSFERKHKLDLLD